MSTKLKILLTSHCDFSWGIHPGPHFPLLEMLFFFFFLSREDANLHGGSGKEKEKVSACFHPQHLAQLSRGEDLKQTEQGRGLQRLSVPLGPGLHVACSALGLPSVLAPTTPCSLRALLLGPIFCSASLTSTQAPLEGGGGGHVLFSPAFLSPSTVPGLQKAGARSGSLLLITCVSLTFCSSSSVQIHVRTQSWM